MFAPTLCRILCHFLSTNIKIKIYRIITLFVVIYGCATSSLTVRKEYSLRMFEKRELRKVYRPEKDEVAGERKRLHSEDFNDFCSPPNIICMIKSGRMGQ